MKLILLPPPGYLSQMVLPCLRIVWILVLFFLSPGLAFPADQDHDNTYVLESMVVTATRSPQDASSVAANISVVTAEEIERLPVVNVAEALQYVPGVYVDFQGGPGSDAGAICIQGSETRHVAIYQDGVPLNQLLNPRTDLSLLPAANIERIEVYKGAASSAWGSSLGGVVNIVTKQPDSTRPVTAKADISYGEHDTFRSGANVSGSRGRLGWLVSGTHEKSDGFMEHTGYRQNSGYAKIDYDLGEIGTIDFALFFGEGQDDQPLPNFSAFWDARQQRQTYQRLAWETALSRTWTAAVQLRHHAFDIRVDDVYANRRDVYNDYQDESWGVGLKTSLDLAPSHQVTAGLDADWGEYDWVYYADAYDTRTRAFWANDTATFGPFTLNVGLRYDDDLNFGGQVSPSAGWVYRFSRFQALVRAQVARGFSAPPAAWVNDPTYGNPDLGAETAVTYQAGGQIQPCRFFRADVNLFRADVDDLIIYDSNSQRFQNVESVKRQGIEGGLTTLFDFGLTLYFGGSYVDVVDAQTDERIKDIPRCIYTARATYTGSRISHTLVGRMVDHNSSFPETRDKRFVWDYKFMLQLPDSAPYGSLSLFANIHNVTDSDYLYRTSRPKPGRWMEGGVRFVF